MERRSYTAVIFDLDGVITKTARLHARAWKRLFDEYLRERTGDDYTPFDIRDDYLTYIDGKLRYDGVRSFLASRGIELPEGTPDDPPDRETICGLGNRKNEFFHELLKTEGAETFDDAVEQLHRWREKGVRTAVISSSRNCGPVLEAVGLLHLFEVKVDGRDSERLGLTGKPAPDIFLEAAGRLGIKPEKAIVIEDALAGVEAARKGSFGLVVGISRHGGGEKLKKHGADIVVQDLRELDILL